MHLRKLNTVKNDYGHDNSSIGLLRDTTPQVEQQLLIFWQSFLSVFHVEMRALLPPAMTDAHVKLHKTFICDILQIEQSNVG